jgi:hypothetical protein
MFDIHSTKLENGIYTFTGLYDDEETELVTEEKNAAEKNQVQHKLLTHFFKSLPAFHPPQNELTPSHPSGTQYPWVDLPGFNNPFREIITPPPQICSHT